MLSLKNTKEVSILVLMDCSLNLFLSFYKVYLIANVSILVLMDCSLNPEFCEQVTIDINLRFNPCFNGLLS